MAFPNGVWDVREIGVTIASSWLGEPGIVDVWIEANQ
jgi:hypothetical protein